MTDVLVLETDHDILECMVSGLQDAGFNVVGKLVQDIDDLTSQLGHVAALCPKVVIYDLGPPPPRIQMARWLRLLQHPMTHTECGPTYIIVTTNCKLPLEPQGQRYMMIIKPMN